MKRTSNFVMASAGEMAIAFPLAGIERVERAVAVQRAPSAGGCLLGTIVVAGEILPLYDTRKLLGAPARPLRASDRIVLVRAPTRCGLLVDAVHGTTFADEMLLTDSSTLRAAGLRGVVRGPDGTLLVADMQRLLALERAFPLECDD